MLGTGVQRPNGENWPVAVKEQGEGQCADVKCRPRARAEGAMRTVGIYSKCDGKSLESSNQESNLILGL